jgi:hypothetical protein
MYTAALSFAAVVTTLSSFVREAGLLAGRGELERMAARLHVRLLHYTKQLDLSITQFVYRQTLLPDMRHTRLGFCKFDQVPPGAAQFGCPGNMIG